MTNESATNQDREHTLARIRLYAEQHSLSGDHIAMIFEAGLGPALHLRPDIFAASAAQQEDMGVMQATDAKESGAG